MFLIDIMNKYLQQDAYFRYYNLKLNVNSMFLIQKTLFFQNRNVTTLIQKTFDFLQKVLYDKTNWRKYDIFI